MADAEQKTQGEACEPLPCTASSDRRWQAKANGLIPAQGLPLPTLTIPFGYQAEPKSLGKKIRGSSIQPISNIIFLLNFPDENLNVILFVIYQPRLPLLCPSLFLWLVLAKLGEPTTTPLGGGGSSASGRAKLFGTLPKGSQGDKEQQNPVYGCATVYLAYGMSEGWQAQK